MSTGLFAPAFNPGEYRWTCCRHPDPKDPGCRKVDADEHIDGKDPNRHKIPNQIHKIKAHKPHKMKKPHLHHKDKDRKEKDHGGEEELDFD